MTALVTGAAGFIGFHVAGALLDGGETVLGVDNLNAYYDPALKRARLLRLADRDSFRFAQADVADAGGMAALARREGPFRLIVHLAAQAGVRYALEAPRAYGHSNLMGQLAMLELCREMGGLEHFVYASSSSVYGDNPETPWAESHRVDSPLSLYAATKRAGELMAQTYSRLHGVPATGLRFFTVYGPWGRPDMAAWRFAEAILAGRPVPLFNGGEMKRDFTYIDDIVGGALAAAARPPASQNPPHRILNIGAGRAEPLRRFVAVLERALGRTAVIEAMPMQPGDAPATRADTTALEEATGFRAAVPIDEGLPRFVEWYRDYRGKRGAATASPCP